MVKIEKVVIDGKEYTLKCSIMTARAYEDATGYKFADTINSFSKMSKKIDILKNDKEAQQEYLMEELPKIQLRVLELAYVMIMEAKRVGKNQDFECDMAEWLETLGEIDMNCIKGVLAVAKAVFPRIYSK